MSLIASLVILALAALLPFLSGCGSDPSFNLDGLAPWMRPIFMQAGWDSGAAPAEDPAGPSVASLASLLPHRGARTDWQRDVLRPARYIVGFDDSLAWADCAAGDVGYDFYYVARHEWEAHIIGWGDGEAGFRRSMTPECPARGG